MSHRLVYTRRGAIDYNYFVPQAFLQALHYVPTVQFTRHIIVLPTSGDVVMTHVEGDTVMIDGLRDLPPALYVLPQGDAQLMVYWFGQATAFGIKLDMNLPTLEQRLDKHLAADLGEVFLYHYGPGVLPPWGSSLDDPRFRQALMVLPDQESPSSTTGQPAKRKTQRRKKR